MTKYKQAVEEMLLKHKTEFEEFGKIHDLYKQDQTRWQEKFDELGKPLQKIAWEAENRLCGKMEGSSLGKYSMNLAEKFREEIKLHYPLFDLIGVKVE